MVVRCGEVGENLMDGQFYVMREGPDFIVFQIPRMDSCDPQSDADQKQNKGDSENQYRLLFPFP